jgi:hypothetical protein
MTVTMIAMTMTMETTDDKMSSSLSADNGDGYGDIDGR